MERQESLESFVSIQTHTIKEPIHVLGRCIFIAEDLYIYAAKYCGIGPISRHLFGLWCTDSNTWLSPCQEIDATGSLKWSLEFKLRFKLPSIGILERLKDLPALDYYFHQLRHDFLNSKIPEMVQHKNKALGLAATDMIREMLEHNLSIEDMKHRYKDFLPRELWKNHRYWVKTPLLEAVNRGWQNSKQNVGYVKEQFIVQVCDLAPDYGSEEYKAQIDEDGKVWEVTLQITPYNSQEPGLRMRLKSSKSKWTHICSIEDLYYISVRKDNTLEISRRNGIPQYVRFDDVLQLRSFVSCLDGYYRLMEKWTFNLCKELPTPSLQNLKTLKCHGPVGYKFSYQKLKEKRNFDPGSYLIRESSSCYDELRVDLCIPSEDKPLTLKVFRGEEGKYRLTEETNTFDTLVQLVTHSSKKIRIQDPVYCVSPSEYDKTRLLLCRPENKESQILPSQGECSCTSQCIPSNAVVINTAQGVKGQFHTVYNDAKLRQTSGEMRPIIVKALLPQYVTPYIQDFLQLCSKVMQWRCQAIVSTVGIILHNPLALVLESMPLGPLNVFLRNNRNDLEQVDLIEAATYLATALWYLEEQNFCHGKIRCGNIMVASWTENSLKVKLSDPGLLIYDIDDYPWIPPECQSEYSLCQYSIQADVFAFGTTMWEIFSYGDKPLVNDYGNSDVFNDHRSHLPNPPECHEDVYKLMSECWIHDPDNRKQPQAIMRDVNQTLYEVYNSRRNHSYATVYPVNKSPTRNDHFDSNNITPRLPRHHTESRNIEPPLTTITTFTERKNLIKSAINQVKLTATNSFSYDQMSANANSGSSERSTFTMLSDVESFSDGPDVPVGSLITLDQTMNESDRDNTITDQSSPWVIDINDLTMGQTLGQGFYGEVCRATFSQWEGLKKEMVAVKRIKKSVLSEAGLRDLLREIDIMKSLRHKNIVEIKGLVEEPQTMLVMEYLELGSLLAYLQMYRRKLTISRLLKFASDIAEGMHYLEGKHIVHRDLAARNILVATPENVKISDFGLAQFTENHYYKVRTERNLPIRWYAPESIRYGRFSHKSDVWSYGVTLWEMFSFGDNPMIPNVPDTSLADVLERGERLSCPDQCPFDVYILMGSCWQMDSHARPSFTEIYKQTMVLKERLE